MESTYRIDRTGRIANPIPRGVEGKSALIENSNICRSEVEAETTYVTVSADWIWHVGHMPWTK